MERYAAGRERVHVPGASALELLAGALIGADNFARRRQAGAPRRVLAALVAVLAASLCWPSAAEADRVKFTREYTPFTEDGLPVVTFYVNGQETYGNFVIDTGTGWLLISDDFADRLKLKVHPMTTDAGETVRMPDRKHAQGCDVEIQFGPIPVRGPVLVTPSSSLQVHGGFTIDGIIGHSLLSKCAILFDFGRKQITVLYPGGLKDDEVKSLGFAGATVVPAALDPAGGWSVPVSLNGRLSIDLVVDTGGAATNIPASTAAELKLKPVKRNIQSKLLTGPLVTSQALVSTLAIGDLTLQDQPVEYARRDPRPFLPRLGMETLRHFRLLMDYATKRFYFMKADNVAATGANDLR